MVIVEVGIKLEKPFDYYDKLLKSKGLNNDFHVKTHDIYYTNSNLDGLSEKEMKNACIRLRSCNGQSYRVENNLVESLKVDEVAAIYLSDFEDKLTTLGWHKVFETSKDDYHYFMEGMQSKI